jgi:protein phosphatase
MQLNIPALSLVVLIGPTSAGKSEFARRQFGPHETVSSDACRALVANDENDQSATGDAFALLHQIAAIRLRRGLLTVIDATNVQKNARAPLVKLARDHHCLPVAIVFDLPERSLHERNVARIDRNLPHGVVHRQREEMRRSIGGLQREGFRYIYTLRSQEEVDAVTIARKRSWTDRRDEHGPFDIVGDVHGCYDELAALLAQLGYVFESGEDGPLARHPDGRRLILLGDLVDRGPKTPDVLRLAMNMVAAGSAVVVPGNHDDKLKRALQGRNVQRTHGLAESLAQLEAERPEFRERVVRFIDGLIAHLVLDDGKLVVAHAGMKEEMQGRASSACRDFALYGETTGETDEFGLPVRYPWARDYRGAALVTYGHTPVPEPLWVNNTVDLDTGCVFGGRLTALRYPERETVSVPAAAVYYQPARPFLPEDSAPPAVSTAADDLPDIADVLGKRSIETSLIRRITVQEENASAALELMSRFAIDPRWLIYLPPTMAPVETSRAERLLEHPAEAFAYFRHRGVPRVVCEQKHMGSRLCAIVCRNAEAAARRFGVDAQNPGGALYTRTGRAFFADAALEAELLARLRAAATAAGFWQRFETDWLLLDCELLPWSAKAGGLLREQYAPTGAAGRAGLGAALADLARADAPDDELTPLRYRFEERAVSVERYVEAYRRYCWPVDGVEDLRIAPFHLLASEGAVHTDTDHLWQMATLADLCAADPALLVPTPFVEVDVTDPASEAAATAWWEELTAAGGEGMVVKPLQFVARRDGGLVQPGLKVRGGEYLRIVYGPEYTRAENLDRLRQRGVGRKRSLAINEFALGVEALQRFVRREPFHRVHECVFAILALESEPVDPRL